MIVWYLVIMLSGGDTTTVTIPQVDHTQCITNREALKKEAGIWRTICVAGASGNTSN